MPMVINGLPAHVLLVHFVVVLVPATALLVILSVAWPAARERIGVFGPLVGAITFVFAFVAAQAGEWFKNKLGSDDDLINRHADLGGLLEYASAAVFVLYALWWIVGASGGARVLAKLGPLESIGRNKVVQILVGAAAVVLAVLSVYLVIMVGDTGAQESWSQYKDLLTK